MSQKMNGFLFPNTHPHEMILGTVDEYTDPVHCTFCHRLPVFQIHIYYVNKTDFLEKIYCFDLDI